ncbi:regulatory protein LacI [Brachyspira pilosicoli WesB]|uniref:Regulatory protein LacI n=1 Tax=Brachyspira pilosicoli WesB TaxID=1161918 RepID=K0JIA9_BRAPL|nr:LacI family DNA-binding transcriptional regulator [Brachyspira pilosicoli]CCG57948.1 regulatory protein LacI [Brachyspira pilosicoli WesB]
MKKKNGIRDVAKMAGVSITTVSFVYNNPDRVKEDTRKLVLDVAKKLNYTPDFNALGLRGKTNLITLIVNFNVDEQSHPTISEAIPHISKYLTEFGYYLLPFFEPEEKEMVYLNSIISNKQICGAIFMASKKNMELLDLLIENGIPTVVIGELTGYLDKVFCVDIDNSNEIKNLVDKLYEAGYKKIAYVSGNVDYIVCEQRLRGYYDSVMKNNIHKPIVLGFTEDVAKIKDDIKNLISNKKNIPDVIVCKDDIKGIYVISELLRNGIIPGRDIGVVGVGGISASNYIYPNLSTLSFSIKNISKLAVKNLNDMIVNNKIISGQKYVKTKFLHKESLDLKIKKN